MNIDIMCHVKNHLTAQLCEGWASLGDIASTICAASEIYGGS